MKKYLLLSYLFLIAVAGNAQVKFQTLYGDVNLDDAQVVVHTFDGGFLLAGGTGPNMLDSTDVTLFRLNANGDLVWSSKIDAYKDDFISDALQLADGTFLLVGTTYSSPIDSVYSDILVMQVDDAGFIMWSKVFGGSDYDEAQSIVDIGNDQYVILGNTWSFGSVLKSALAMKINAGGDQFWTNISSTTISNYFYKGAKTDDGFIAVGGTFNVSGGTNFDHYVTKFDSTGNIIWSKRYGTIGADWSYAIENVPGGGYIVAGLSVVNTSGGTDQNIFKLDAAGNVVWNFNYGGLQYERPSTVRQTANGNFVIAGFTNVGDSLNVINQDLLEEIDTDGNLIWARTYGDVTATSECYSMVATNDGYALAGYTIGFQTGNIGDAYFVKTDTAGFSGCYETNFPAIVNINTFTDSTGANEQIIVLNESTALFNSSLQINQFGQICFTDGTTDLTSQKMFSLYPNPASENLMVHFTTEDNSGLLKIKDLSGRILKTIAVSENSGMTIPVKELASGLYIMSYENEKGITSTTFIRQ